MSQSWVGKLKIIGFNKSVIYSLIGKLWLLIGGLLTSFLIATYFSPELQGYYYAFNSLLILTVFAELGLSSVIINFVSHEWLKLEFDENKSLRGDDTSISRLISLCHFSIRWFIFSSIFLTVALIAIGWLFWADANHSNVEWQFPWIALSLITGLNLIFTPVLATLEGCNQVGNLYKFRFTQYFVTSVACWIAIVMDAGLWSAFISTSAGLFTILILSWINYQSFLRKIFFQKPKFDRINWREDILPMQWRIALSWIGGYFTFALFVPILFKFHGPVLAGQMGMTWAFIGALMSISSAWISPHAPSLGLLVASKSYSKLDESFKNIFIVNTSLMTLGAVSLETAIVLLNYIKPELAERLLPPGITAIFLVGTVVYTMGLPIATYLRAHKQEPLTNISIFGGALNGILVIIFGIKYGAIGIAVGYMFSTFVTLPFLIKIFLKKRKEWH